jgi:hypothetical protein
LLDDVYRGLVEPLALVSRRLFELSPLDSASAVHSRKRPTTCRFVPQSKERSASDRPHSRHLCCGRLLVVLLTKNTSPGDKRSGRCRTLCIPYNTCPSHSWHCTPYSRPSTLLSIHSFSSQYHVRARHLRADIALSHNTDNRKSLLQPTARTP